MFEERERRMDNVGQMIDACLFYKFIYAPKGSDVLNKMQCYIYIIAGLYSINIKIIIKRHIITNRCLYVKQNFYISVL